MPEYVEIACLGDSIANGFYDETGKGWVVRLIEKLNARKPYGYYLNNFARSGNRSSDVFHELCHNVIAMRPNVLLISIGTNDLIRRNSPNSALHLSDALREEYWIKILDIAKNNVKKIFVFGLIPVDEKTMPFLETDWSFNADIQKYNQFLSEICAEYDVNLINFYDGFTRDGGNTFFYDGSHPDTNGHEWMAQFAFENLKDKI